MVQDRIGLIDKTVRSPGDLAQHILGFEDAHMSADRLTIDLLDRLSRAVDREDGPCEKVVEEPQQTSSYASVPEAARIVELQEWPSHK
jgi:hypothetical protein